MTSMNDEAGSTKSTFESNTDGVFDPFDTSTVVDTDIVCSKNHIGQLLLNAGIIAKDQLANALSVHSKRGGEFIDVLFSLGHMKPSTFFDFLLSHSHLTGVDLSTYEVDPELISLLPADLARKYGIVPIDKIESHLILGVESQLSDENLEEIEKITDLQMRSLLCATDDIEAAINKYYPLGSSVISDEEGPKSHGPYKLSHVGRLIRQMTSLPALPETVSRVREAMENPDTSMEEVIETVTLDPPVAAKVLSTANSAAYGFQHQIKEVKLAIPLLGLRETYSIVLAVSVVDFVKKLKHIDYRAFWLDSMCCAAAARIVAKASGRRHLAGIFSAGLLHDIGRAVLWQIVPGLSDVIKPEMQGQELIDTELEAVGISHAEAGYQLALHWNLPSEISEPMRFHHSPLKATKVREHVAVIALADRMIQAEGTDFEQNKSLFNDQGETLGFLGLDIENIEAMLEEYLLLRASAVRDAFY